MALINFGGTSQPRSQSTDTGMVSQAAASSQAHAWEMQRHLQGPHAACMQALSIREIRHRHVEVTRDATQPLSLSLERHAEAVYEPVGTTDKADPAGHSISGRARCPDALDCRVERRACEGIGERHLNALPPRALQGCAEQDRVPCGGSRLARSDRPSDRVWGPAAAREGAVGGVGVDLLLREQIEEQPRVKRQAAVRCRKLQARLPPLEAHPRPAENLRLAEEAQLARS